jgi:hypothetical protein
MNRETKLNIIALVVVLALLFPGAVILVKKKMRPALRPAWIPDPVRHTMAYMVPGELPPGMDRVNPERTAAWIRTLRRDRSMSDIELPLAANALPAISEQKTFQLMGCKSETDAVRVAILSWTDRQNEPALNWSLRTPTETLAPTSIHSESIELPDLIRQELGENGLLLPPKHLNWIELRFPLTKSPEATLLRKQTSGNDDYLDIVPSFTKPAAPTN